MSFKGHNRTFLNTFTHPPDSQHLIPHVFSFVVKPFPVYQGRTTHTQPQGCSCVFDSVQSEPKGPCPNYASCWSILRSTIKSSWHAADLGSDFHRTQSWWIRQCSRYLERISDCFLERSEFLKNYHYATIELMHAARSLTVCTPTDHSCSYNSGLSVESHIARSSSPKDSHTSPHHLSLWMPNTAHHAH